MTEGAFKPKRVLDAVLFGDPMDGVNDGFEGSLVFGTVKESEMM